MAGLTGADDPAAASDEGEGRTRAQAACTKDVDDLPTGAVAFDYSYVGLTEQLSRETRSGREQKYDYTASGERLGRLKGSGSTKEWRAYDTDAQGTVVGLEKPTNGQTTPDIDPETGKEKLNTYETDPFGAPVGKESDVSDEAKANPFRFQGFYNDPETGTYDMQARTYQPSTGRFLQQDRFEDPEADLLLASDPLTSSRYAFTAGNPGTRAEYDGHYSPVQTAKARRNEGDKRIVAEDRAAGRTPDAGAAARDAEFSRGASGYVDTDDFTPTEPPAQSGKSSSSGLAIHRAVAAVAVDAGKGAVDGVEDLVDLAQSTYQHPGSTLWATARGLSTFVGPNAQEAWMGMVHDQCDGVTPGRCGGRLGFMLVGGKGLGAGLKGAGGAAVRSARGAAGKAAARAVRYQRIRGIDSDDLRFTMGEKIYKVTDAMPGGTSAALRFEQRTGILLSRRGHYYKASERRNELYNRLHGRKRYKAEGPLSDPRDRQVASEEIARLESAMEGESPELVRGHRPYQPRGRR